MRDETVALHGGFSGESNRASTVPIYQTVTHELANAEEAGRIFDLESPGFHYNRINNPTNDVLERRLAELERGVGALTLSSGAAAVYHSLRNLATAGSNIVASPELYGATYTLFAHGLAEEGIEARIAPESSPEAVASLIDDRTRAVFCESISNPAGNVIDLDRLSELAHERGVPVIVDNTIATPLLCKPVEHGADVVVHSLTKFVGGHGVALGGVIVDGGRFPWADHPERFPMLNRPEPAFHGVVYTRDFPTDAYIVRCRTVGLRNGGSTLAPFNAFLLLQGLETLAVRLERQIANARSVAEYLRDDPRVAWVRYAGFPDHPSHAAVERHLGGRSPSILTFGVDGGYEPGIRFFDSVRLFKRVLNLGDTKSLVVHPASTTHRQLGPDDLAKVGITADMIRLSIGIEHIDDLLADLDQALTAARAGGG
ncbi:MAG: O-acetylhomoserine aminocarboxypropyltransferase/cysteine synthase family protein [Acidimicrobiales bacterium]